MFWRKKAPPPPAASSLLYEEESKRIKQTIQHLEKDPLPHEEYVRFRDCGNSSYRAALARNPHLSQKQLCDFVADASYEVRRALASREGLPEEIQKVILVHDPHSGVLAALAKNPSLLPEFQKHLLERARRDVALQVALVSNPNALPEVLSTLAQYGDPMAKKALCQRDDLPEQLLGHLLLPHQPPLEAEEIEVAEAALQSPSLTPGVLFGVWSDLPPDLREKARAEMRRRGWEEAEAPILKFLESSLGGLDLGFES